MEHMVMVIPKNSNIGKAERIGEKNGQAGAERAKRSALRHFHIQHHDGDDDCNYSIRERFKPLLTHLHPLSFQFASRRGRAGEITNGTHMLVS